MVYQPGCYEWECPSCGHITAFSVPLITCEKNRYTEEGGFLPRPRKYYISDYNKDDIARLPCKDENNIWFTTYI